MTTIEATILVEPTAKGRPRMTVVAGHARAYTPKKTVRAEAQVIADIRHQLGNMEHTAIFGPGVAVKLTATFYRPRPASLPKRVTLPVSRPDMDNYVKLLEDALNHFAFPDDAQITTMVVRKRFAWPGEVPRIELRLEEDTDFG
jgi:Holliday junction resolvase RusA-like endonuclease